ncbi:MAG: aldehyde dehydrogenase family protein [Hyphomicrobiaceae bacterium TMED74]|nr:aldehyde dehydrogenase family protein [Filomicrobium sp.]RPG35911.1 MAG: aldehyde dehydrogenase family protein [Hyphomicrobiaceae bacterium TMED74]
MITDRANQFFINGEWVDASDRGKLDVINPATEEAVCQVTLGNELDVDKAVAAARAAFPSYSQTTREQRIELLNNVVNCYKARFAEMGQTISTEMGAPISFATRFQAGAGMGHYKTAAKVLENFHFHEDRGTTAIVREPIGVIGMITPWNWPSNQISCKVAAALASGCTMVLKPSEVAPLSALLLAEILDEAGVPKGVFNLVNGDGMGVGQVMAAHQEIDAMSFTGSTGAGIDVAIKAAPTVKRVGQELGGKSANVLLDDCDLAKEVAKGVDLCFRNAGQSCNAPTRMLVPSSKMAEAAEVAKAAAAKFKVGDPASEETTMGPVVSERQWAKIQSYIAKGMSEGATLVTGGEGRPEGLSKGYYVQPTVFADVKNDMTIAQEEIFGPVLAIIGYEDEAEAVKIANDSPFGLAAYVSSGDADRARKVARALNAGMVHINMAVADPFAPFGGTKQSGNGREWGEAGLEEYLEVKSVMGWNAA